MKKDIHPKKYLVDVRMAGKFVFKVYSKTNKTIDLPSGKESHMAWSPSATVNTAGNQKLQQYSNLYEF